LAREVIAAAGFGEAFGHSLGHGVGLAVHETPNLSPSEARRGALPAGCVLTVEPGIYLTGWAASAWRTWCCSTRGRRGLESTRIFL